MCLLVAMALLGPRPIDPSLLMTAPLSTSIGLLGYFTAVGVPFFFAGLAIATPLTAYPEQANRLYAADLLGAGLGCAAAVASLTWGDGPGALVMCASVFGFAAALYATTSRGRALLGSAALATAALSPFADRVFEFTPVESKAMGKAMTRRAFKPIYQQWSPINRVDLYSAGDSRRAWWATKGISESFHGFRPRTLSIQYDGHNGTHVHEVVDENSMQMLDSHLLRAPYLLLDRPDVLVIGVGGGIDVQNALRRNAKSVVGVDLQPITVELLCSRAVPAREASE